MPRFDHDPVLTVQVDVDGLKNLMAFYGLKCSEEYDENIAYRLALPRFAELFEAVGVPATFFVVGEDLTFESNQEMVRQLCRAGHEIANHTQTHRYDFSRLSRQQKRQEIEQAGRTIESVTEVKPTGFRAPGYDVDRETMEILADLGYCYDSSIMPSILNLPLKLVQSFLSKNWNLSGYGSLALILAHNYPYRSSLKAIWCSSSADPLWEIPVSCVPYLRLPFYANFNLFTGDTLFQLSSSLARGRHCNYVFHAVEMLDPSEVNPCLHRHPNLGQPLKQKIVKCRGFLQELKKGRRTLLSKEFALELENAGGNSQLNQFTAVPT
jgi:peptidoglycan-N-acetylglucosamine deacetylase